MAEEIGITTRKPNAPPDADFAIYIDFKKNEGSPYRVFKAAETMIRALQRLDKALCVSVDSNIQPIMVLEEIETGSLRIWLRNKLVAVDDQALKDLDWRPAVGKYLVRAKYAYIRWTNRTDDNLSLADLGNELKKIAEETDVKYLPDYSPPSAQEIGSATKELQLAKQELIEGDKMQYLGRGEDSIDFDLRVSWTPESLEEMSIRETAVYPNMTMNLIVKKPDYLGASKWDFRHGNKSIPASMADFRWLADFHARKFDIRPGDALRCKVTVEYSYGYDGELVKETFTVTEVEKLLIEQLGSQGTLKLHKPDEE